MSDASDEGQGAALGVAMLALAVVVAGVLAIAISGLGRKAPATPASKTVLATAMAAAAKSAEAASDRVYFEVGSAALPADAATLLNRIADKARANPAAVVRISGFHDASGDPAQNAELAKNRALAVRHALEANGVAAASLMMSKPAVTSAGGDPREARRVELTVE